MPRKPGGAKSDKPPALDLQSSHPLFAAKVGGGPHIEMEPVLAALTLGYLLKEDPRTGSIRVLQGRGAVALIGRDTGRSQEVIPGRERVLTWRQFHPGRCGVDIAEDIAPEDRQRAGIVGVKGHLNRAAHQRIASWLGRSWVCRYRSRSRHTSAR